MPDGLGRLKSQADFRRVFRDGRRLSIGPLVFWWLPGGSNEIRLGVVISKKTAKLATRRNYLRRVLRHLLMAMAKNWGDRPTGDMVVMIVSNSSRPTVEFEESSQQWLKKF